MCHCCRLRLVWSALPEVAKRCAPPGVARCMVVANGALVILLRSTCAAVCAHRGSVHGFDRVPLFFVLPCHRCNAGAQWYGTWGVGAVYVHIIALPFLNSCAWLLRRPSFVVCLLFGVGLHVCAFLYHIARHSRERLQSGHLRRHLQGQNSPILGYQE